MGDSLFDRIKAALTPDMPPRVEDEGHGRYKKGSAADQADRAVTGDDDTTDSDMNEAARRRQHADHNNT